MLVVFNKNLEEIRVISILKNFLKNIFLLFFKAHKYSIILNYHRIGNINPKNPFHRLHTISLSTFKLQIKFCSLIGKFVSLDDIYNSKLSSKLSFCITFDDVSNSIYSAIKWLDKEKIPFAICPCQQITEESLGWRDKVYLIEKFLNKKDIINSIKEKFPKINFDINESFYSLSKNLKFDQQKMINDMVNPLYEKVYLINSDKVSEKNYFTSDDLINLRDEFKDLKFVNHSFSHSKLNQLSNQQLFFEIDSCDKFLENLLGKKLDYFAVPFGGFDSQLCIALCEVMRSKNKKAIFWVSNHLNLDIGYKPNKIKQFCRFHTSNTVVGLCKQNVTSFFKPHFLEETTRKKRANSFKNSSIVFNPKISKILAFEDFARPIKDYSGNKSIFEKTYISNPYLLNGNHTIAEVQDNYITAIGQNLVMPFSNLENNKVVNLFGNYRAIRGTSKMSAVILIEAVREYELSISYKPSKIAEPLLKRLRWNSIPIKKYTCDLDKLNLVKKNPSFITDNNLDNIYEVERYNSNSSDIIELTLSKQLLQWRVQNYILANPIYFILEENSEERAFVVGQYNDEEILLLDQRYSSPEIFEKVCGQIILWSKTKGLIKLIAETSCISTQKLFEKILPEKNIENALCYLSPNGVFKKLKDKNVIITPLSSDVLLR